MLLPLQNRIVLRQPQVAARVVAPLPAVQGSTNLRRGRLLESQRPAKDARTAQTRPLPSYAPRAQCVVQVLVQSETPNTDHGAAMAAYCKSRNLRRLESHVWDEVA